MFTKFVKKRERKSDRIIYVRQIQYKKRDSMIANETYLLLL